MTAPKQVGGPTPSAADDQQRRNLAGLASTLCKFADYVAQQFFRDKCLSTAASLSYTTLLSVVPLMAVMFTSTAAFPAFEDLDRQIESFVFDSFVPSVGDTLRTYLHEFSEKATALRSAGILFLFVTVLLTMSTIEVTFNSIWQVTEHRRPLVRFLVYWAVLTIGPLLVGIGLVVTSYLISLPLFTEVDTSVGLKGGLLAVTPFLSVTLAFTLIYKVVPNRMVRLKHAVLGGLIAGLLFELAKRGFAFYLTYFPTQEAIYGTFASIPVFLLWIYLSWVIVLLGAEITHCLTSYPREGQARAPVSHQRLFFDAFAVVGRLWHEQTRGRPCDMQALLSAEPDIGESNLDVVITSLLQAGWVQTTQDDRWVLTRDLEQETLLSLYQTLPGILPIAEQIPETEEERYRALIEEFARTKECLRASFTTPLKRLYEPPYPA